MTRKIDDPGFRPKAKYLDTQYSLQMTKTQRQKLGLLARWAGNKPVSGGEWIRRAIDAATLPGPKA